MQAKPKDRPILMNGPMVRALLAGTKTQTRRLVKGEALEWLTEPNPFTPEFVANPVNLLSPFGFAGDTLWVRETWRPLGALSECAGPEDVRFAATADEAEWAISTWRPSIHMPRWASRLTLRVTDVQVQRVKSITEAEAEAEGFGPESLAGAKFTIVNQDGTEDTGTMAWSSASYAFATTWAKLYGLEAWTSDPWVWKVVFERIQS